MHRHPRAFESAQGTRVDGEQKKIEPFVLAFGHVGPEAAWLLGRVSSSAKVPLVLAHRSRDL